MGEYQQLIKINESYKELDDILSKSSIKNLFLVCGNSARNMEIGHYFENIEENLGIKIVQFSDFSPNPQYDSVVEGVKLFCREKCEMIAAIGGGSAIDVAKCIKLFLGMDESINYLQQKIIPNEVKLLAVPTTAGTGSEATRFAVIYYKGEKQSISDDSCIPSIVVFDSSALKTLPEYYRKSTMMDALCHAIESFWSVNSTKNSLEYSTKAIQMILKYMNAYLSNTKEGNSGMQQAAFIAGKAINITQTTAGHAMCYKLTSMYGIAHGHAAALCISELWPYMISHLDKCVDKRGNRYLNMKFNELAMAMGCSKSDEAIEKFRGIVKSVGLKKPYLENKKEISILKASVNLTRLKNNPVKLDDSDIEMLYHQILDYKVAE